MNQLRISHKKADKAFAPIAKVGCVFCRIERNESNSSWVLNLEHGSVFLNFNQSFQGRILYIPFNHYESLSDMPREEYVELSFEIEFLASLLKPTLGADLINIAMLGNEVNHIHWHIIPRYRNDGNWGRPPWPNTPVTLSAGEFHLLNEKIRNSIITAR